MFHRMATLVCKRCKERVCICIHPQQSIINCFSFAILRKVVFFACNVVAVSTQCKRLGSGTCAYLIIPPASLTLYLIISEWQTDISPQGTSLWGLFHCWQWFAIWMTCRLAKSSPLRQRNVRTWSRQKWGLKCQILQKKNKFEEFRVGD